jgi:hypothetical protein
MALDEREFIWSQSFNLLYEIWNAELQTEELIRLVTIIDRITTFLVTITATTSAVAGWAIWGQPGWKEAWIVVAGAAALLSAAHTTMQISASVQKLEPVRLELTRQRRRIEQFRSELLYAKDPEKMWSEYRQLVRDANEQMSKMGPDILLIEPLRRRAKEQVDEEMYRRGYSNESGQELKQLGQ